MANKRGNSGNSDRFYFLMLQNHCGWLDFTHEIKRRLFLGRKVMTNLDSILKSRDITLLTKIRYSQSYCFSGSHVRMWELDYKEGWALKNWSFWNVMLEKTLESPLSCKEINPVNPKGNQLWIFVGRTDAETEALVLWSLDGKRPWYGERLKAGGEEDVRGWDDCMASLTQWTWVWACHQLKEMVKDKEAWHAAVYRMAKSWMWLSDWTTAI